MPPVSPPVISQNPIQQVCRCFLVPGILEQPTNYGYRVFGKGEGGNSVTPSQDDLYRESAAKGFQAEYLEKVQRLLALLELLRSHPFLSETLNAELPAWINARFSDEN